MISESSPRPITALRLSLSRLRRPDLLTPPRQSWPLSIDSVLAFFCLKVHAGPALLPPLGVASQELPLVCQKCNPTVTRRDPTLGGKLLRQKCVSVGAPSCPAPLHPWFCLHFSHISCPLYSQTVVFGRRRLKHACSVFMVEV